MRCTQIIGINEKADKFLEENIKIDYQYCGCPDCKTKHVKAPVELDHIDKKEFGMFDDGPILRKYQLVDDSWVYEFIQADPWSSGPCIFLALSRDPEGNDPINETLWDEEEIKNA